MTDTLDTFDQRLKHITKTRSRMRDGYVGQVSKDGLIVFRPKRRRLAFSPRGFALVLLGFVGFKALIMAHLGLNTYQDRITALQQGSMVEQAGALRLPFPGAIVVAASGVQYRAVDHGFCSEPV